MKIIDRYRKYVGATLYKYIIITMCVFPSCSDFLSIDNYLDEELKLDSIFSNKRYIEAYMWDAASSFPDEGDIFGGSGLYTPGPLATDEAFTLFSTNNFQGMGLVLGEVNADYLGKLNRWGHWYQIIRRCNTIFARIDEASDWTTSDRLRVLGYTRFIRAYAYYNILLNFGPPVLLGDEVINNNEEVSYYDRPRCLYDEAVEYICAEFENAAPYLYLKPSSVMEYGVPTQGAAYALVARLRLIHASPLFNGGAAARAYFSNWKRKTDGEHYISQTYDGKRWAVAAVAAKRVMEMTDGGGPMYRLHTIEADDDTPSLPTIASDPDYSKPFSDGGAAGIDPYRSYSEMFTGETVANINPEFIWARNSPAITATTKNSFPRANGGDNGLCIPQKIIDAYEMADGRTISNASASYPYSETGFTSTQKEFSGYRLNSGVSNMYVNREARFYASIGFSECFWNMQSTSETSKKNLTITYYFDSPNGRALDPTYHPITGYVLKKYIHPIDAWDGIGATRMSNKPFPIIRYAEILLGYAEALNSLGSESYAVEVEGTSQTISRDAAEIKNAFNQVRHRAGLPGLTDAEVADQTLVLAKIKKERMIEFLCENQRYFDVRRWGDYEQSENEGIRGMNTSGAKATFYQRTIPNTARIGNRIINRKFAFLPIPKVELKRLPSFDQNPGWE
ncbi:membrane protein [Bacteroidia bacterium]|nr:membrane protein [Bacteroidia bacterium]